MRQLERFQWLGRLMVGVALMAPLYAGADERPEQVTQQALVERVEGQAELRTGSNRGDLEGVVLRVNPNGDDFVMRTNGDRVFIEASGGVKVWFEGRSYRIRDLEPGDVVGVQLASTYRNELRARSVDVIRSVSHDRYRNDRGSYDDSYGGYGQRDDGWRNSRADRRVSFDGRVVSINKRYDELVVRNDRGMNVTVDLSRVSRSYRSLRVGDIVRVTGMSRNGGVVALDIDVARGRR